MSRENYVRTQRGERVSRLPDSKDCFRFRRRRLCHISQIMVTGGIISHRILVISKNKSLDRLFVRCEPVPCRVFMYFERKFNCPDSADDPSVFPKRPESCGLYHPLGEVPAAESRARQPRAWIPTAAGGALPTQHVIKTQRLR